MPTTFTFEFGLGLAAGTGSAAAAAVLPLLPLDVRIWLPYEATDSDEQKARDLATVEAEFEAARAFWLHYASIDLRLWRGKVDVIPDAVIDEEGYTWLEPDTSREPLEVGWRPGTPYLTVRMVNKVQDTRDPDATTWHHAPWYDPGFGIIERIDVLGGHVLAHEIGHALGLSHTVASLAHAAAFDPEGDVALCLEPFENDMVLLTEDADQHNLMFNIPGMDYPLADRWLSPSQVKRARLTIFTRQANFARIDGSGAVVRHTLPVTDDISGAALWELFALEPHRHTVGELPPTRKLGRGPFTP